MSKFCQHNSSACALEQPTSALLLEFADLAADMRLACAIGQGNFAQAPEFGGINEQFPLCIIHGLSPPISISLYLKCQI
jgi:hypothetical protein